VHSAKECLENLKRIYMIHINTASTPEAPSTVLGVSEAIEITSFICIG
jgi:hypothetical protein